MLKQDKEVSEDAQKYLLYYMPGILIYGLCDLNRRFLNSFRKNAIPMLSFAISVTFHAFWIQELAIEMEMKIIGIALAGVITNILTLIIIKSFMLS